MVKYCRRSAERFFTARMYPAASEPAFFEGVAERTGSCALTPQSRLLSKHPPFFRSRESQFRFD
jgi:hypothetical protein